MIDYNYDFTEEDVHANDDYKYPCEYRWFTECPEDCPLIKEGTCA